MIHSYSLVHDDLPAMDDDALRRGRPTSHVVYGDGLAILAGDGLLTEAFGVHRRSRRHARRRCRARRSRRRPTRRAARRRACSPPRPGAAGMVGGQAIDLAAAGTRAGPRDAASLDAPALEDMHARKTGALIRAAAVLGAIIAGAERAAVAAIDDYARDLGLAFQIIDDVLDVEGSNDALGKTAGKDAAAGKPTYPALYGLEESRRLAAALRRRAPRQRSARRATRRPARRDSPTGASARDAAESGHAARPASINCSSPAAWRSRASGRAR